MRLLLIAAFVVLTAALAYYAAFDFGLIGLRAPAPEFSNDLVGTDGNVAIDPMPKSGTIKQPYGSSGGVTGNPTYSMSAPRIPIPQDLIDDRDDALNQINATIKAKQKTASNLHGYAHNISWAGSICSWVILGISAFLKNAIPDSDSKDSGKKNPMPRKSAMIGALAVGAAVCPLTAGKMEEHVGEHRQEASELRDDWYSAIDILDVNADTSINEWKKKIAELTDKAEL